MTLRNLNTVILLFHVLLLLFPLFTLTSSVTNPRPPSESLSSFSSPTRYNRQLLNMFIPSTINHPTSGCERALEMTKERVRLLQLARSCVKSKQCRLSVSDTGQHILEMNNDNKEFDAVDRHSHSAPIHEFNIDEGIKQQLLSRHYSRQDWKLLSTLDDMERSSIFFDYPTLRLHHEVLMNEHQIQPTQVATSSATYKPFHYQEASSSSGSTAENVTDKTSLSFPEQLYKQNEFPVNLKSISAARDDSNHCNGDICSLNPSSIRNPFASFKINDTLNQICKSRSRVVPSISHLKDSITSNLQDAKQKASQCRADNSMAQTTLPLDYNILHPTSKKLNSDERLVTFLEPLGSGKEAEVWRVCINPQRGHYSTEGEFVALKIYRRQFRLSIGDSYQHHSPTKRYSSQSKSKQKSSSSSSSSRRRSSHSIPPIPQFDRIWSKLKRSLHEAIDSVSLLPQSAALVPHSIWNVDIDDSNPLTLKRLQSITRYTVYNGYGAAFDIADEDLESFTTRQPNGIVKSDDLKPIAHSLIRSLSALHDLGYVWLDLKPQNILMVSKTPKIGDVGFIRPVGELMKMPGVGTAGFRPFEALAFMPKRPCLPLERSRSVFALGVTLYYMAVGTLPWNEREMQLVAKDAIQLKKWELQPTATISGSFKDLLEGLLHPNPNLRITLGDAMKHSYFIDSS